MKLKSTVFGNGGSIPTRYTGEGEDVSPPMNWSDVPDETREFALICEDPDAPGEEPFVHWVAYNISGNTTYLPEGLPAFERIEAPVRADQGKNSFGNLGYGGPLPPRRDPAHRYVFKLYALNAELGLPPGSTRDQLSSAMQGHVLDAVQIIGTYARARENEGAA